MAGVVARGRGGSCPDTCPDGFLTARSCERAARALSSHVRILTGSDGSEDQCGRPVAGAGVVGTRLRTERVSRWTGEPRGEEGEEEGVLIVRGTAAALLAKGNAVEGPVVLGC